jgi:hypothetical protein
LDCLERPQPYCDRAFGRLLAHLSEGILSPDIRWKAVSDRAEIINDTISSDPNIDAPLPA